MTNREFHEEDFYAFAQQTFDEARHFLKNCGRPSDQYDAALIKIHKQTAEIFKAFLD